MSPPVPPQVNVIGCSVNEDNSNKFIFANSTNSESNTTENAILFSQKHVNDQIRNICLFKEKA